MSIVALCRREGIESSDGRPVEEHVDYMLDPRFFNQVPARRYVEACDALQSVELVRNDLALDEPDGLTPDVETETGHPREELLASAHTLVARKRPFEGPADLSRTLRTRSAVPCSSARPAADEALHRHAVVRLGPFPRGDARQRRRAAHAA